MKIIVIFLFVSLVFLFSTEINLIHAEKYEIIYLLDNDPEVVTNVVKNKQQLEREQRIGSFIELVESKEGISFDFKKDLKEYCRKKKIDEKVENAINNILEEL